MINVVLTLCHMKMLFPLSFFTVMVHLVEDAKLEEHVHYGWMYPIEILRKIEVLYIVCITRL